MKLVTQDIVYSPVIYNQTIARYFHRNPSLHRFGDIMRYKHVTQSCIILYHSLNHKHKLISESHWSSDTHQLLQLVLLAFASFMQRFNDNDQHWCLTKHLCWSQHRKLNTKPSENTFVIAVFRKNTCLLLPPLRSLGDSLNPNKRLTSSLTHRAAHCPLIGSRIQRSASWLTHAIASLAAIGWFDSKDEVNRKRRTNTDMSFI